MNHLPRPRSHLPRFNVWRGTVQLFVYGNREPLFVPASRAYYHVGDEVGDAQEWAKAKEVVRILNAYPPERPVTEQEIVELLRK